jgi:hypothetical protein
MKVLFRVVLWGVVVLGTFPLLLALLSPGASWRDAAAFATWLVIAAFGYRFLMRLADEFARRNSRSAP